jgi:hypothetical protein
MSIVASATESGRSLRMESISEQPFVCGIRPSHLLVITRDEWLKRKLARRPEQARCVHY